MLTTHTAYSAGLPALRPALLGLCLGLGLALSDKLLAEPNYSSTEQVHAMRIEASSLADALNQLARETGLTLSVDPELLRGKSAPALSGDYAPQQALQQLLEGTGLRYRFINATSVILETARQGGPLLLDSITVQGEKLDRDLMQTTTSVAVQSGELIARSSAETIQDSFRRLANISGSRNATFSIRGIASSGSGFSSAPLASLYVDGVQTTFNQLANGVGNLFDTEQVEVLRGPQSTSQGGAALAGAVVLKTKDPSFDWQTITKVGVAEYNTYDLALAQGGPLTESLAYRMVLDYDKTDGFIDNPTRDAEDNDFIDTLLGRFKLLYQPADGDLRALLTYYRYEGENGSSSVWNPDQEEFISRSVYRDRTEIDQHMLSLELSYQLSQVLSLTSISAVNEYQGTFIENRVIGTLPADPGFITVGSVEDDIYSQELRLNLDTERLQGLVGWYYNYKNRGRPQSGSNDHITTYEYNSDSLFESYSLFSEADFSLTEHWTLTLGGRYEQTDTQTEIRDDGLALDDSANETAFIGKAGVRYRFNINHMLGFTFAQAYRPGGMAIFGFDPYDPEFLDNYELSYRGRFFEDRVSLNANLFYLQWTDLQTSVIDEDFNFTLENAGDARSRGGELELSVYPSDTLEIYAAIGLAKGEYKEFRSGFGTFDGNEFEDAPQENYVLGLEYSHEDFSLGVNMEYTGSYFADVQNTQEIDSRTIVDLVANYSPLYNLTATFYANNLFDKHYEDSVGFNRALVPGGATEQPLGSLGDPRILGVKVLYEF